MSDSQLRPADFNCEISPCETHPDFDDMTRFKKVEFPEQAGLAANSLLQLIPAQAAEGVIISVIFAGETEQEPLAAAAVRIKARWALTPVDKLSDFQKTKANHEQAPRLRGLLL